MTMLQAIWHVFSKLHKYVATSAYQKATPRAKPTEVIIKDVMMDIETVNFVCSWMSDYPTKDVFK